MRLQHALIGAIFAGFALQACSVFTQPMPELADGVPVVRVDDVAHLPIDAVLPTDLIPLPDGGMAILDGYQRRLLIHEGGAWAPTVITGDGAWGRPVRGALRVGGGFWLCDPGDDFRQPALVAIDALGATERVLEINDPDNSGQSWQFAPTSIIDTGDLLLLGDRLGRVAWVDRRDGTVVRVLSQDVDDAPLVSIADLVEVPGGLLAVDTLGAKIHHIGTDGVPTDWIGQFGLWVGRMMRPKSVAPTALGNLLVADTGLGAVHVFDPQGKTLGILGDANGALRFAHPIAVRAATDDPTRFYVLDQTVPEVLSFVITLESERRSLGNVDQRYLRTPLVSLNDTPASRERICLQCHDGFVNDTRQNWDPRLEHHPVDFIPEREIPAFFPVDDDGRMVCATCHSPHGEVSASEIRGADAPAGRAALVRHPSTDGAFTRMSTEDSSLCTACHGDASHEEVLRRLSLPGGTHPVGESLIEALSERTDRPSTAETGWMALPAEVRTSCLGCHDPHGAAGEPILASVDEGTLCLPCHADHATQPTNHPMGTRIGRDVPAPRREALLIEARDGGIMCRTCHDLVGGGDRALLRAPRDGGVLCLACHDARKGLSRSPHSSVSAKTADVPCLGCHDLHGAAASSQFVNTTRRATPADPTGCLTCHGDPSRAKTLVEPRTSHRMGMVYGAPLEGLPLHDGRVVCGTCHEPHQPTAGMLRTEEDVGALCLECHDNKRGVPGTDHDGAVVAASGSAATCVSCHDLHGKTGPYLLPSPTSGGNPASGRCLTCHDGTTGATQVKAWSHPEGLLLTVGGLPARYSGSVPYFGPDGTRTTDQSVGEITCMTCHDPHQWQHDSDARPGAVDGSSKNSFLRDPAEVTAFCAVCHGVDGRPHFLYFHTDRYRSAD